MESTRSSGVPDAHQIAGALVVEVRGDLTHDPVHLLDRLAHREAAQRQAVEGKLSELLQVAKTERHVRASLDDAKESLVFPLGLQTSLPPAGGGGAGVFEVFCRALARRADIQLHGDVSAEQALNAHRLFRRELVERSVVVGTELESVLGHLPPLGQGKCLKST